MLMFLVILLIVLWFLGMITSTMGGLLTRAIIDPAR